MTVVHPLVWLFTREIISSLVETRNSRWRIFTLRAHILLHLVKDCTCAVQPARYIPVLEEISGGSDATSASCSVLAQLPATELLYPEYTGARILPSEHTAESPPSLGS